VSAITDYNVLLRGVAFCDDESASANIQNITVIQAWPGFSGNSNEKVPSRIAYVPSGGPSDHTTIVWGNSIRTNIAEPIYSCLKLKLEQKGKMRQR
jgi:hypothetical protein